MYAVDWELVKESQPPPGWFELEDNTWDALISALAGEENVVRRKRISTRINDDDQEVIDSFTDEYLAAADVPLRPHGYDWFLRPPRGLPDLNAVHTRVNRFIGERLPRAFPALPPEKARELVGSVLRRLYS